MIRLESQHYLPFPRDAVWPVLRQTDWLNRSLGLPPVDYSFEAVPTGGSTVTARARVAGLELRWKELPFEWLEPEFYRVRRIFETGPFAEARMGMDILEEPGGGSRAIVYSELLPHNVLGRWVARRLLGPKTARDMRRIFAHIEQFLRKEQAAALPRLAVKPVIETELTSGLKALARSEQPQELVEKLERFLRTAPDLELSHIRPLAIAREWKRDSWKVLELFLHATRSGLLNLSWEVLCPNCRSSRTAPISSLSRLKATAHCEVCQIQFNAEFDKSVELKFAVNPAVRPYPLQTFCMAGPGGKPHILSQLWLEPREERNCRLPQSARPLRLRSPQVAESILAEWNEGAQLAITCEAERFIIEQHDGGETNVVTIRNPNAYPLLVDLEEPSWSDDILTAARVTNWQEFRDLFASEVVSPREQVTVGSQVILFTDLCGSTAIYHGMGDAPAYVLVRKHFEILAEAIGANHGGVVKTIGDSVMAAFSRIDEALAAVRQMHANLAAANPTLGPRALKTSLHVGPCLAVNANDRLDFFGTTINLAARMVDCCNGGDLAVSDELYHRPEMEDLLRDLAEAPKPSEVQFRGFAKPHRVWRIDLAGK